MTDSHSADSTTSPPSPSPSVTSRDAVIELPVILGVDDIEVEERGGERERERKESREPELLSGPSSSEANVLQTERGREIERERKEEKKKPSWMEDMASAWEEEAARLGLSLPSDPPTNPSTTARGDMQNTTEMKQGKKKKEMKKENKYSMDADVWYHFPPLCGDIVLLEEEEERERERSEKKEKKKKKKKKKREREEERESKNEQLDEVNLSSTVSLSLSTKPSSRSLPRQQWWYEELSQKRHFSFYRTTRQMWSIIIPVIAVLFFSSCYILFIFQHLSEDEITFHRTMPYRQQSSDSSYSIFIGSLYNASTVIAGVFIVTMLFVVIFHYEASRTLLLTMQCLMLFFFSLPWSYFIYQFCRIHHISLDYLSFIGLILNWFSLGIYIFFYIAPRYPHSLILKIALIFVATGIAWPFLELYEETLWTSLILLIIYDLLAVLLPFGPLRYIMSKVHTIDPEAMLGLIYRGEHFILGLGDMVFFGVLSGRAARYSFSSLLSTSIGVLFGVLCTIVWTLNTTKEAVPALPISLFYGLLLYFFVPRVTDLFIVQMQLDGVTL